MSTLVIVLRACSLLAFAAPLLLRWSERRADAGASPRRGAPRAPVVANFAAFGLFVPSLLMDSGSSETAAALPLALTGCVLAVAGAALVFRSRLELGSAWSLVPKADRGLVTTGPYRVVRHPIYLGLLVLSLGQALAFGSWLASSIVLVGLIPTFAWRARSEDRLLSDAFGERHALYRRQTRMIIPHDRTG